MTTAFDLINSYIPKNIDNHLISDLKKIIIYGIADNSNDIKENYLFLALKGIKSKSHHYLNSAIKNKAAIILLEGNPDLDEFNYYYYDHIPIIILKELREKIQSIATKFYKNQLSVKKIYAVTGTNGKTSVAHFITQILNLNEIQSGYIGTLGYGNLKKIKPLMHTTPSNLKIAQIIDEFNKKEIDHISIETSSHALNQKRTKGLKLNLAIFTNITQDHLDYHKSFENYLQEKLKIFNEHEVKNALIYTDNSYLYKNIIKEVKLNCSNVLTYGINCGDIYLDQKSIQYSNDSIQSNIFTPWGNQKIELNLLSKLNLLNIIPAIYTLILEKFSLEKACKKIKQLKTVRGRMQKFKNIIIDFSHTPNALENALKELKLHYPNKQIEVIFGCGGNRDTSKRKLMGDIAFKNSDSIIITEDNPRDENNKNIVEDIIENIKNQQEFKKKITIIHNRQEAINYCLERNNLDNKVILIAGKGHETIIQRQGDNYFFSDMQHIRNFYKNET